MSDIIDARPLGLGFVVRRDEPKSKSVMSSADSEPTAPALRPFRPDGRVLESPLSGVSNEQWTDFAFAMKVGRLDLISPSNGLGMFDMRYKRLADLGLVENLRYKRDVVTNRSVQVADWLPPLTRALFLKNASAQLKVFVASMKSYFNDLRDGLPMPEGASMSGCLAILHRGGHGALAKWNECKFESTLELFNVANGVF